MSPTRLPRITAAAAALLLSTGLVACGSGGEPEPAPQTSESPTASTTLATPTGSTTTGPETTAPSPTDETTTGQTEETTTSTAKNSASGMTADVEAVYEVFNTLAPKRVFEDFESCNPTGIEDSFECSGRQAGQFQFFKSSAKAASTTQLLTELRSSRVVEDTGRRVVGWSTLGTTAVITVVDNDLGLVMQQMVSSDQVDPEEKIYELGLVQTPADEGTAVTGTETTAAAD